VIEIESGGNQSHFSYNRDVQDEKSVHVVNLRVKDGAVDLAEVVDAAVVSANVSQEKWGMKTEQFVKVGATMPSAIGTHSSFWTVPRTTNQRADSTTSFFLHPRLEPHRKVFEVIGEKTKCRPTDGQLSGLGFSSTKRESFIVRATQGKKRRLFNVHVGS
jgi:hypothetical protein